MLGSKRRHQRKPILLQKINDKDYVLVIFCGCRLESAACSSKNIPAQEAEAIANTESTSEFLALADLGLRYAPFEF